MKPRLSILLLLLFATAQLFAQVPRFLPTVSYPVPGATMVVVADVNGDGILDLVTANGASPTGNGGVSILLGIGNGKFHPQKQIVKGGSPSWVVVGDFNNDGKADIAVANEASPNSGVPVVGGPPQNSVSILLGNGNGTFKPAIITPTAGALELAAADFNGDGKLDLAVSTGAGSPVQILLNNGDGTFAVSNTAADSLFGVIAGDFNGDGKPDILAAGLEMIGNGDGTFTPGPSLPVTPVLAADFNGDGILDLVELFVSDGRFITGLMGLGLPGGQWAPSFIDDFNGFGLVAADFNGDGKMDIFGTGDSIGDVDHPPIGGLGLGRGDGTFSFGGPGFGAPFGTAITAAFPAAGDLDRNGSPDIVVATGTAILVALNTSGHPPLLAQLTTDADFVVGGATTVTGTISLGGPAPAGGAVITLASSSPAATFPNGKTVKIPAGESTATFLIATGTVTAATPVTISATYHATKLTAKITMVEPFTLASISAAPASLIGMFGGDVAVGTITLNGPAADGTVVTLASANPAVLTVPASVTVTPGTRTATFPIAAQHVAANTTATISAKLGATTKSVTVTVQTETPTVTVTKAEYVVKKSLLTIEASSTDRVINLQLFNPATGVLVGVIPIVNVGKFSAQFIVAAPFTSAAVQDSLGGLAIVPVAQK